MTSNHIGPTAFHGPVIQLPSVDSTNNYAAKLVASGEVAHGTVILADEQTDGRGQRDNLWKTRSGDLTMSIVLRPRGLRAGKHAILSQIAGLAVKDVLDSYDLEDVRIKWPNDVLVGDHKVAGILIESGLQGEFLEYLIIGVGINLRRGVVKGAISLHELVDVIHEPSKVMLDYCEKFHGRYLRWIEGDVPSDELDSGLWRRGVWSPFLLNGDRVESKPLGINKMGQLLVELEGGDIKAYGTESLRHAVD